MKGPRIAARRDLAEHPRLEPQRRLDDEMHHVVRQVGIETRRRIHHQHRQALALDPHGIAALARADEMDFHRSEEHTSELQSLMRISYAVFCLKKKKTNLNNTK